MNDIAKSAALELPAFGALERALRARLVAQMAALHGGRLRLQDALGEVELGTPDAHGESLRVNLRVLDPAFYRAVAANGSVGAGEAYMDGLWECDDPVALVRLLVRNRDLLDGMEGDWRASAASRSAPGTPCSATPAPAAGATSPRTTT